MKTNNPYTYLNLKRYLLIIILLLLIIRFSNGQTNHIISTQGTNFLLNDKPFDYTGISFFNALYNPSFNKSKKDRIHWLKKFQSYGINVIRVWAQWDNTRGFVDSCKECTLYFSDGSLNVENLKVLKDIIYDADHTGMIVLFVLFQRESWNENIRLSDEASDKAVKYITDELKPFRNLVFQIWNEFDYRTVDYYHIIKSIDPDRLVTNSPGYAGFLGSPDENNVLDFLSPHTTRTTDRHWHIAPQEIAYLLQRYNKPVVDDEPARKGTQKFGGPTGVTDPYDHIIHMIKVLDEGGYVIYHHNMFQTGYESNAVPPSGIPDPEYDPYHLTVFEFLKIKNRYFEK